MAVWLTITLLLLGAQQHTASRLHPQDEAVIESASGRDQSIIKDDNPSPPVWPDVYTVSFSVSIPALYFSQPQGLSFPVTVWYDRPNRHMRYEVMHGVDTTITTEDIEYTLFPRINETRCGVFEHGPVRRSLVSPDNRHDDFDTFLPDLSSPEWVFGGTIDLDGKEVHLWESSYKEGTKTSQYTFYTAAEDGRPLKFFMTGIQFFSGGHFDEYNYEFSSYAPHIVWDWTNAKDGPFVPPDICKDHLRSERLTRRHPIALQAKALKPHIRSISHEDAYHSFAMASHDPKSRPHTAHMDTYNRRLDNFKRTLNMIHQHNADSTKSFKMRLNHWADWDDQEFIDLMLPNKARKEALEAQDKVVKYQPLYVFESKLGRKKLPREVDWRGTGADPGVKDQAMCGSCFAFAATATMEGTWYVQTGQHRSFSEQQILSCSWDYPNQNGCGGGDYQPAIMYIAENGGIALEQNYPYVSNDDFCKADNVTKPGKFKGYIEIKNRDEEALMEAVATLGPIAVAVDAEWDTFRYYAEGVYTDSRCTTKSRDLDHAVVLFGYGTTPQGEDYWLVRNTWSKFYGDDGHIKIKRGKHDCGISSDPAAAVPDDHAVVPGMAAMKRLEAAKRW